MTGKPSSFRVLVDIRDVLEEIRDILGVMLKYRQEQLEQDGKIVLYELADGVEHWVIEALARIHQEIEDEGYNEGSES